MFGIRKRPAAQRAPLLYAMANCSKRDARQAWALDMAANRKPPVDNEPRCYCREVAVIAFYPVNRRNRFFCEAHKSEAEALIAR